MVNVASEEGVIIVVSTALVFLTIGFTASLISLIKMAKINKDIVMETFAFKLLNKGDSRGAAAFMQYQDRREESKGKKENIVDRIKRGSANKSKGKTFDPQKKTKKKISEKGAVKYQHTTP